MVPPPSPRRRRRGRVVLVPSSRSMLIVDVIRSIRAFCRGSTPAFDASSLHFLPRRRFRFRWFFSAIRSSTRIRINFVFQEQSFARVAQHVLSERVERAQSLKYRRVRNKDFVNKTSGGGGDQRRTADERKPKARPTLTSLETSSSSSRHISSGVGSKNISNRYRLDERKKTQIILPERSRLSNTCC